MTSLAVLGSGSWGTTFAKVLAHAGSEVQLWSRRPEVAYEINTFNRNTDYLPEVMLPSTVSADTDVHDVVRGKDAVFLALPSQELRANLREFASALDPGTVLVSLIKGVEKGTNMRMSSVIEEEIGWPAGQVAVVSGPNIALEIAREEPSAAVVSCVDADVARRVAKLSTTDYFTTFTNTDVIGTEFGGTLKNLVAVAVGIVHGVGYGENTKASIITRGLAEITRFAVAYGASPSTMTGLAGLGDLIATCESPLSRNHTAGRLLGEGKPLVEVIDRMQQLAEGLSSVHPILALAEAKGVEMPIVRQVAAVLEGRMEPQFIAPHLTSQSDTPSGE
ncbi:MAG TPA: NAD(P)-dependent glycerol-3-phosphate dehydrogenase [Pseudoclavibacter sp.]|nr:NAD(P)-dependent glycerol-3-phosphate dehydrogenase [Pseudoclavibacter sp.]